MADNNQEQQKKLEIALTRIKADSTSLLKLQSFLIDKLRDSNNYSSEEIYIFWQSLDASVEITEKSKAGISQAGLAGEVVHLASRRERIFDLINDMQKIKKLAGLQKLIDDILSELDHDAPTPAVVQFESLVQFEIRRKLEDDICKIITGKMDTNKIRKCYLESMPPRVGKVEVKNKNDISLAVNHLTDYGGQEGNCCILDFLQLLRVTESKLRIELGEIVDRVCSFYGISEHTKAQQLRKMEEKAKDLYKHPSMLILKIEKDAGGEPKHYRVNLKNYRKGKQDEGWVTLAENIQLSCSSDLALLLSSSWLTKIQPHLDDENQSSIVAVPRELLAWDIDLLKIELTVNDSFTLSSRGPVSFCCLDRYGFMGDTKIKWNDRWKQITVYHARVVKNFPHMVSKCENEIARDLQECASGRWTSCLVEGRLVDKVGEVSLNTNIGHLWASGVPAMTWVRNDIPGHYDLLPDGDFHRERLLDYAFTLREGARKIVGPNPIAFLLDHPDYKKDGIV